MHAMRGLGSDIADVPFVCAAQQQLYQTARQLYPGNDAQQVAYVLTHGAGFGGNWQAWCAQQPVTTTAGATAMQTAAAATGTSMPWWVWMAVPVVIGGAYAFGREMGWFGKVA